MSKIVCVTRDGRPATAEELQCAVEGKPLPDAVNGRSVLAIVLSNLRRNVVEGIRDAQQFGIAVEMPEEIEVDLALNVNGLPCSNDDVCCARLKTVVTLKE